MKVMNLGILLAVAAFGSQAFAAEKSIECTASGKSLSNGGSPLMMAKADLNFAETKNAAGLRVLKNIEGSIRTADSSGDFSNGYIGHFKIGSRTETANYHPRKYVGFSQFLKVDATDTNGSAEDGMWGQFVIDKNTRQETFEAHYIFQAGDHMGGTLHFVCKTR